MNAKVRGRTYPCRPPPYKVYPKYPCKGEQAEAVKEEPKSEEVARGKVENTKEAIETKASPVPEIFKKDLPRLKHQCSFPYFRRCKPYCIHRSDRAVPRWRRIFWSDWKKRDEKIPCLSESAMDSYERLCRIPLCKPEVVAEERIRAPFTAAHCVFCDTSLYYGGYIYDLEKKVPLVRKLSEERDDDIAYRIGIRSRITVHKSCYEEYFKRPVTTLDNFDEDACEIVSEIDSEASCTED